MNSLEARKQALAELRGVLNIVEGIFSAHSDQIAPMDEDLTAWVQQLYVTRATLYTLVKNQERMVQEASNDGAYMSGDKVCADGTIIGEIF